MTVRVALDGWELGPLARRRGMGRVLAGLLPVLATHADLQLVVLRPAADGDEDLPPGVRLRAVSRAVPRHRSRTGSLEHAARLPLDLRRVPHDVAWAPGDLPLLTSRRPWVQTLHDLAPLDTGVPGDPLLRARWRLLGPRVRRAARVVAVSRASADEGVARLDLDPARVVVVPHGVDDAFRPDGPVHDAPAPYVAAVVAEDPRKGLEDLAALTRRLAPHRVEVAGSLAPGTTARLTAAGAVVRGHVADLPAFLRGAEVVVSTSHHEGFGLVPLEAMACGTPVAAYAAGAVQEVTGEAAELVAVGDVPALAGVVRDLLADPTARRQLAAAGLHRAQAFTWPTAARAYAEVLGDVA